jgi:hypothetical protein
LKVSQTVWRRRPIAVEFRAETVFHQVSTAWWAAPAASPENRTGHQPAKRNI